MLQDRNEEAYLNDTEQSGENIIDFVLKGTAVEKEF